MRRKLSFAFPFLAVLLCSCPCTMVEPSALLTVENRSDRFISAVLTHDGARPDSTVSIFEYDEKCRLWPYTTGHILSYDADVESAFKNPTGHRVWFYSNNLETDNYLDSLLCMREYSVKELNDLNWTIVYSEQ